MGITSFFSCRAICASVNIVPALCAFSAGANQDDNRMRGHEGCHLCFGFLQCLASDIRIVPGTKPAGRFRADDEALFHGTSGNENSLVSRKRVVTAAFNRSAHASSIFRVTLTSR